MAASLFSDLFVPEVALAYAQQGFFESLAVFNNVMGNGPDAPIRMWGDPQSMFGQGVGDAAQYVQAPKIVRLGTGLVTTRDVTSNAGVTPLKFTAINDKGVKLNRKVGTVEYTLDSARLAGLDPMVLSASFGMQAGQYMMLNIQNSVIAAARGFVEGLTAAVHTSANYVSTGTKANLTPGLLNNALTLMGDARSNITTWIIHGSPWADLFGDSLNRSFTGVGNLALDGVEGLNKLGRQAAYVDSANLTSAPGGYNKYFTLGMGRECMDVYITLPLQLYPQFIDTSRETVTMRLRGDFDFEVKVNGAAWNSGAGGANPTDAALATSSNWTPTYTSHKEAQIVEVTHNYSGN